MNHTNIKIFNGKIITPHRLIEGGSLLISNGKIVEVSEGNIDAGDAMQIDASGRYISPGFIDIHVHGGGGHDFMDNTLEAFFSGRENPCTSWNHVDDSHNTQLRYERSSSDA